MPKFIAENTTNDTLMGVYNMSGARTFLPVRADVQIASPTTGQVYFVQPSGECAIYNGTGWSLFDVESIFLGMKPDNPEVSGALEIWLSPGEWTGTGASGVNTWSDIGPDKATVSAVNVKIASGESINGADVPYYDGANNNAYAGYSVAGVFNGTDKPITMIAAVNLRSIARAQAIYALGDSAQQFKSNLICGTNINGPYNIFRRNDTNTNSINMLVGTAVSGWQILSFRDTGASGQIWKNGTELTAGPSGTSIGSMSFNRSSVGRNPRQTPDSYYDNTMGDVLVYSSGLTDTQRNNIEKFLSNKWGITLD